MLAAFKFEEAALVFAAAAELAEVAEDETCVAEMLADEAWGEVWIEAEEAMEEAMEDAIEEEAAVGAAPSVELDAEPPVTRLQISAVICCVAEGILVS